MKRICFVLMAVAFFVSSCAERGAQTVEPEMETVDGTRLVTVEYRVEGMTCTGCENTVNYALEGLNGVTEVHSSFADELVRVTYDSVLVTGEMIDEEVTGRGYTFAGRFEAE
jgi:copper chaperone CopZ